MIEKTRALTLFLYQHHFVRYVFVGGTTFILDFSILFFMHGSMGVNVAIATSIAYWTSIVYNFCLNRYWTFSVWERQSLHRHITAYLLLLGFNYLFNVLMVSVLSHFIYFGLAKVIAVGIQMLWTYPIYKRYIFIKSEASAS